MALKCAPLFLPLQKTPILKDCQGIFCEKNQANVRILSTLNPLTNAYNFGPFCVQSQLEPLKTENIKPYARSECKHDILDTANFVLQCDPHFRMYTLKHVVSRFAIGFDAGSQVTFP